MELERKSKLSKIKKALEMYNLPVLLIITSVLTYRNLLPSWSKLMVSSFVKVTYLYVFVSWLTGSNHFPIMVPFSIYVCNVKCILKPAAKGAYSMPWESRFVNFFVYFFVLLFLPFWTMLWAIDDVFFSDYMDVSLGGTTVLVGGYRTGSTTLHRLLALDEKRFVSPKLLELLFPFLCVHLAIDKLASMLPTAVVERITVKFAEFFEKSMTPEVLDMHPMSVDSAEEDDLLLSSWHRAGYYAGITFLHPDKWIDNGRLRTHPLRTQERYVSFYMKSMQKILYRRPGILLTKSHMIELMPLLRKYISDVRFLGLFRNPKSSFTSWYALSQAALSFKSASALEPSSVATAAHLRFWDNFTAAELEFFRAAKKISDAPPQKGFHDKVSLTFNSFIKEPVQIVSKLYAHWGLEISDEFAKALDDELPRLKSYKNKSKKFLKASLEDLGTSEAELSKRYKEYIKVFNLE